MEILGIPAGRLFCALVTLACVLMCVGVGLVLGAAVALFAGAGLCAIAAAVVAALASGGGRAGD